MEIGNFSDFLHSTWMFNVNGLYQVAPEKSWGFDVSANIYARQGYPLPYYRDYVSGIDGRQREVQAVRRVDDFRTDDIATVDLRLSKDFSLVRDQLLVTLMADLFNALNEGYVMRRELALNSPRSQLRRVNPEPTRLALRRAPELVVTSLIRNQEIQGRRPARRPAASSCGYSSSRWTMSGEKAGTQMAMYSAPPGSGVL